MRKFKEEQEEITWEEIIQSISALLLFTLFGIAMALSFLVWASYIYWEYFSH